jgi:hypothetical protein
MVGNHLAGFLEVASKAENFTAGIVEGDDVTDFLGN